MRSFRGLTKEGKWVYGWYLEMPGKQKPQVEDQGNGMVSCQLVDAEIVSCIAYKSKTHVGLDFCKVIPETVGQFTGLYDKNDKELDWWEGDLFRFYLDSTYEIKWIDGAFYFSSHTYKQLCSTVNWWATLPKKIGNRFENPELLEQDNE